MKHRTGVLLINLGTPDAPRVPEVRRYLRELLSDPRVLDMNPLGRWLLLNLVILPFRPRDSAAKYRLVWRPEGSPLLYYGQQLRDAVAKELGDHYVVDLGMRYGEPTIAAALERLLGSQIDRLIALPLFPQYASATTGSVVQRCLELLLRHVDLPQVQIAGAFYDDVAFIEAVVAMIDNAYAEFQPDYTLLSYHGLPEHQVRKSESPDVACDRVGACPSIGAGNRMCYRAQCFETSRLIAAAMGLGEDAYGVSFQSRLGRTKWIQPYTEEVLPELAKRGIKRLMVASPSFVADCLETLEELGIRLKERWLALGGEAFKLVPSLNIHPQWVAALANKVRRS